MIAWVKGAGAFGRGRLWVALGLFAALAGCVATPQGPAYQRYSSFMVESGRFRTETAPVDAAFSQRDLLRNFELVVFEPEEQLRRYYKNSGKDRRLSKWVRPIRYALIGDGVTRQDERAFEAIAKRLSALTGLSFEEAADAQATMKIFILTPEARQLLADRATDKPSYPGSITQAWVETLNPPCFALFETASPQGGEITSAAIFIKAELREPLRGACLIEEATQSLGAIFDHNVVRPSIFNDDQEFIALTDHDEALIRLLYDPRLPAGTPRAAAVAKAREILGVSATDAQR